MDKKNINDLVETGSGSSVATPMASTKRKATGTLKVKTSPGATASKKASVTAEGKTVRDHSEANSASDSSQTKGVSGGPAPALNTAHPNSASCKKAVSEPSGTYQNAAGGEQSEKSTGPSIKSKPGSVINKHSTSGVSSERKKLSDPPVDKAQETSDSKRAVATETTKSTTSKSELAVGEAGIQDISKTKTLDIADRFIDSWTVESLAKILKSAGSKLEILKWSGLSEINSTDVPNGKILFDGFPKLLAQNCPNLTEIHLPYLPEKFNSKFLTSAKHLSKCSQLVEFTIPNFPLSTLAYLPKIRRINASITLDDVTECSNQLFKKLSTLEFIGDIEFSSMQTIMTAVAEKGMKCPAIKGFRGKYDYNLDKMGHRGLAIVAKILPNVTFDVTACLSGDLSHLSPIYDRIRSIELSLFESLNELNQEALGQMIQMEKFSVNQLLHKSVSPEFFKFLENFHHLTSLEWADVHVPSGGSDSPWALNFDVTTASQFVTGSTSLKTLSLARCVCDVKHLESWLASCQFPLKCLKIRSCLDSHSGMPMMMSGECLNRISAASPTIEYLMLTGCTDEIFGSIADRLPKLRRLVIRSGTRDGVLEFMEARKGRPNLAELSLVLCPDCGLPENHPGLAASKITLCEPDGFSEDLNQD